MWRFRKAVLPRMARLYKATQPSTLEALRGFLTAAEPQAVEWLVTTWQSQGAAITYKQLREAIQQGEMSLGQLQQWQTDYAQLVNEKLAPQWQQAMEAAAQAYTAQYPYYLYNPSMDAVQEYVFGHGAELVTNLADDQCLALNSMIQQASSYEATTPDELARVMRASIGLTKPQAKANLNLFYATKAALLDANPRMRASTATKRATDAAAKYAGKQHRYRALSIARTELSAAYNYGGYAATKDAQGKGYIGETEKVWVTGYDERVCPICGKMEGERVKMDAAFSSGVLLPPAHPQCRCAVAYEEVSPGYTLTPVENDDTIKPEAEKPKQTTTDPGETAPAQTQGSKSSVMQATDVFENIGLAPDGALGGAVHSDSGMVEGMNLTARTITIDYADYYEVSGKLTDTAWGKAVKRAKAHGYKSDITFESESEEDGAGYFFSDETVGNICLDGYKVTTKDQGTFEIYSDNSRKKYYAMGGYFRARVPIKGVPATDTKAMNDVLDKMGLKALTKNPTAADELLLKKSRLVWQHAPSRVADFEDLPTKSKGAALDAILDDIGIGKDRVAAMELREVYPGYSTYVDDAAVQAYRDAGLKNVWAGVTSPDDVVTITTENGFTATNYRITSGIPMTGASPLDDMETGGSDSVFTRIGVDNGAEYSDNHLGQRYRIIIDPKEMARTDWYAYTDDSYGDAHKSHLERRLTAEEFVTENKQSYQYGNEIMFRHGISKDSFIGISCERDDLRDELLDKYRRAGITQINGVPVGQFVRVSQKIGK